MTTVNHSREASAKQLFLPDNYDRRGSAVAANTIDDGEGYWAPRKRYNASESQWHVYELAQQRARERNARIVWDVGCGIGTKLIRLVGQIPDARGIGFDQPFAVGIARAQAPDRTQFVAADLNSFAPNCLDAPDLIVCADVLEHLEDPVGLLHELKSRCGPRTTVLVSTPDRIRLHGRENLHPINPLHVQEWSVEEFRNLAEYVGFRVAAVRHYPPTRMRASWRCAALCASLLRRCGTTRITMCFELGLTV